MNIFFLYLTCKPLVKHAWSITIRPLTNCLINCQLMLDTAFSEVNDWFVNVPLLSSSTCVLGLGLGMDTTTKEIHDTAEQIKGRKTETASVKLTTPDDNNNCLNPIFLNPKASLHYFCHTSMLKVLFQCCWPHLRKVSVQMTKCICIGKKVL